VPNTIQVPGFGGCASASFDGYNLFFYDTLPANVIGGSFGAGLFPAITQISVDAFGNVDAIDMAAPATTVVGFGLFAPNIYDFELDFTLTGPTLKATGTAGPDANNVRSNQFPPEVTWTRTDLPEPAPLALWGLALSGLALCRRRRA
jgi:hypothetical protein